MEVFRIWRNTGSICGTPSFRVHMLRLYQDASNKRLTDSSGCVYKKTDCLILNELFTLNVSCEREIAEYALVHVGCRHELD